MDMTGQSIGYLSGLSNKEHAESIIDSLVNEAIKTSSKEDEFISRVDLVYSIRKNLAYTMANFT